MRHTDYAILTHIYKGAFFRELLEILHSLRKIQDNLKRTKLL